jgi:hypothetical protein
MRLRRAAVRLWRWLRGRASDQAPIGSQPFVPPVESPPTEPPSTPRVERVREPLTAEQRAARAERKKLLQIKNKIAAEANDIIDRFTSVARGGLKGNDRIGQSDQQASLRHMANKDLLYLDHLQDMPGGSGWCALSPTGDERELVEAQWPVSVGMVVSRMSEDERPYYDLVHFETADPASLRGKVRFTPKYIGVMSVCQLFADGEWYADVTPVGLIGDRWTQLDVGMRSESVRSLYTTKYYKERKSSERIREEINRSAGMAVSLALTERYSWHAALDAGKGGPRLLLPTNPKGCLALFSDRHKRDEERRRAALKHWVHNHFRASSKEGLEYVRDHLRGATEFNWYGLGCELMVSEFDLEKNDAFRHQASEWRKQRKHNRVRVRMKR